MTRTCPIRLDMLCDSVMSQVTLNIDGMHCASCVARVEDALRKVPGVRDVGVNLALNQARVDVAEGAAPQEEQCRQAVENAGYHLAETGALPVGDRIYPRFLVGALLTAPVAVLSMLHVGFPYRDVLFLLVATIVQFWCGWPFLAGATKILRHRAADMNTLIAMGTLVAFLQSAVVTLAKPLNDGHGQVFFEAQMVIITLVLLGRLLEERVKGRASEALRKLLNLRPPTARLWYGEQEVTVPVEKVDVGDIVIVQPGEQIPVDGTVTEGQSEVNEAMLTGEPLPASKQPGEPVTAGTLNLSGLLRFKATKVGAETKLAQIIRLVEEAQTRKAPVQRLADRVAGVFVPVVIALALLAAIGWLVWGSFQEMAWTEVLPTALTAFVATLIVACPCALGLATPMAIIVGTGRGAELGILIRSGEVLEKAERLDLLFCDKTGTLTKGEAQVTETVWLQEIEDRKQILSLVVAVEQASAHPLAKAIVTAKPMANSPVVERATELPGRGIDAKIQGHEVLAGNALLLKEKGISVPESESQPGSTQVFFAVDGTLYGFFRLTDPPRAEAAATVFELRRMGLEVQLLTGDQSASAAPVAKQVGIEIVHSGVKPEEKAEIVKQAQNKGRRVAMVGDGINDAPALAQADLGLAMGTGTDVAREAGDIVLMRGRFSDVVPALTLARQTLRVIRQNLFFAFIYNVLMIPLAALGYLHPMLASVAMVLSSLSVTGNSLRLRKFGTQSS
jgi:P-type Cu+ transporter